MGTSTDSIRVVGEADLLALARCARSTRQSWCRKGLIEDIDSGLYGERDVLETLVVGLLVEGLDIRRTQSIWRASGDGLLADCLAISLDVDSDLDAVVDMHTWALAIARDDRELFDLTRPGTGHYRSRLVLPLGVAVREARLGFWARALPEAALTSDKRRRKARGGGSAELKA